MTDCTMISLPRLVSTCADAARRGCTVIRSVQARREAVLASAAADATTDGGGNNAADALKEASSHGIQYKVDGDPRSALTEADGAAQEVILHCLRHRWGADLHIVGEEDEDGDDGTNDDEERQDVFERYGVPKPEDAALNEDILSTDSTQEVPLSSVTLFVDPMDGTREFVEGRLGNVQCLVGVVVDGQPVGGVVGLPFAGGRTETQEGKKGGEIANIQVVHALLGEKPMLGRVSVPGSGSSSFDDLPFCLPSTSPAKDNVVSNSTPRQLIVYSGDSRKPEKDIAIGHLRDICSDEGIELDIRTAGGCGTKMMQLALCAGASPGGSGKDAIAVMPRGTCSWDTAAPTAMFEAALQQSGGAGHVSDFYGESLVYDGVNVTNRLGVLASSGTDTKRWHVELCKRLQKDKAVG